MQLVLPKGKVRSIFFVLNAMWHFFSGAIMVVPKVAKFSGMTIFINQQKQEVADRATLQSIVFSQTGEKLHGIAVAVNQTVIPRQAHADFILKNGDQILIIKATQGG